MMMMVMTMVGMKSRASVVPPWEIEVQLPMNMPL